MNSTQQSMSIALQTAVECATLTTQSILKEKGVVVEENEIKGMIKQRFDYILEDSGTKANIMGRAATVDQALNGEKYSAIRNRNWMTAYDTVKKLDSDVNQLRMLLTSKGIDMKMRVLNTCFKVYRKPGKSSSIIEAKPLAIDKLKRGEIIEVDFEEEQNTTHARKEEYVQTTSNLENESATLKKQLIDLQHRFDEQIIKYSAYQRMVVTQHREWKDKVDKLQEELEKSNRALAGAVAHVDHLNRLIGLLDTEKRAFLRATTETVKNALMKSEIDDAARDEYVMSIDAVTGYDEPSIRALTHSFDMIIQDYSDSLVAAKGLANRLGYSMQFEPAN